MAYGRLNYQGLGSVKTEVCSCCNGGSFIDSHTVCPECGGGGTKASQVGYMATMKAKEAAKKKGGG